jgi:hypothetical protein
MREEHTQRRWRSKRERRWVELQQLSDDLRRGEVGTALVMWGPFAQGTMSSFHSKVRCGMKERHI